MGDELPEMAKKSAVKRLSKLAPRRGRFAKAIEPRSGGSRPEGPRARGGAQEASKKGKSRAQQVLESLPAHELTPAGDSIETGQTDLEEAIANAPREPTDEEIAAERGALRAREEEEGLTSEVRPRGRVDRLRLRRALLDGRLHAEPLLRGRDGLQGRAAFDDEARRLRLLRRELLRCLDRRLGVKVTPNPLM